MEQVTYPPLDVPKPVTDGLWIVDSGPLKAMGVIPLPVRMTAIRLDNGDLLLHSPTRYAADLRRQLEEIGPIRHLVAPNIAHWSFLKDWQQQIPDALVWAPKALSERGQVQRSGLRIDHFLDVGPAAGWPDELERIAVFGAGGFVEIGVFHRPSRTLILADLVQNLESHKLPLTLRPFAAMAGILAPDGRAPAYLRASVRLGGHAAREAGRQLIATTPERVVFAHGRWFDEDGARRLKHSLRWLAK